jgi:nucleoside-diphosphate-sugar epimerase
MAYGLDRELAHAVNVRGAESVLALAASAPHLRRFVHISGFRIGHDLRPPERLGAYEASKFEADALVRRLAAARAIPLTLVHPAAVVGDSRTGELTNFFGLPAVMEDLHARRMPAIPGTRADWLPIVAVDYLAAFLAGIPEHDSKELPHAITDHVVLDDATPTFGVLVHTIARHLGVSAPRLFAPKWLVATFLRLRGEAHKVEALDFLSTDTYDTASARAAAGSMRLQMPPWEKVIEANVGFWLASRAHTAAA